MPRSSAERRRELADAGIDVLAAHGLRGATHRAVEQHAGLPTGTASNYFPTRDELLAAIAERAVALHLEQMARIDRDTDLTGVGDPLVALLESSLLDAVTTSRHRYLALFELQLEASRRPRLAAALAGLAHGSLRATLEEHADLDLRTAPDDAALLVTLYSGVLHALVTSSPSGDAATVRRAATAIVAGARAAAATGAAP